MECSVVKRNGSKVAFDQCKLESAIEDAFDVEVLDEKLNEIVDSVLDAILDSGTMIISTEEINDHVERSFMALKYYDEARNFILYREQNKNIRKVATDNDTMSEYIFMNRYARYLPRKQRRETWNEAVDRVRDMHIKKYPEVESEIIWAFEQVRQKRVLPSMRSMQFGGKPIEDKPERIYNCFSVDVEFITESGVKSFKDFKNGDTVKVLTHTGSYKNSIVKSYPASNVNEITFKKNNSKGGTYKATPDHNWILSDGSTTSNLKVGDKLLSQPNIFNDWDYDKAPPFERLYWAYGLVCGDGTRLKDSNGIFKYSMIRLCGNDTKFKYRFEELGFKTSTSQSLDGDCMVYTGTYCKTLPDSTESIEMLTAFCRGLLDADGEKNSYFFHGKNNSSIFKTIQQSSKDVQDFIRRVFPIVGVYIISEDVIDRTTNFVVHDAIRFKVSTACGITSPKWRVSNINNNISCEEVWCLEVEDDHSFVFPNGIVTGNCTASPCNRIEFFGQTMELLLAGCGVGFDVTFESINSLPTFITPDMSNVEHVTIDDSIEGWSDSIQSLMNSYVTGTTVEFIYKKIRKVGSKIKSGGNAPGHVPLRRSLEKIRAIMDVVVQRDGNIKPIEAYDVVMHISDAVLSGGVRRCLPENYEVKMSNGEYTPITDLIIGDEIIYDGESYPIGNIFDNGVQELIKIETDEGYHISTPSHRWLVYDIEDLKLKWKTALSIEKNPIRYSFVKDMS